MTDEYNNPPLRALWGSFSARFIEEVGRDTKLVDIDRDHVLRIVLAWAAEELTATQPTLLSAERSPKDHKTLNIRAVPMPKGVAGDEPS